MLKAIVASFIGAFIALIAAGTFGYLFIDRTIEKAVAGISVGVEQRLAAVREQIAEAAGELRDRASDRTGQLAGAIEARQALAGMRAGIVACVQQQADGGAAPVAAVEHCLDEALPARP